LQNLYQVSDSVFRSEQPDGTGFAWVGQKGIRSILNLREKHTDKDLEGKTELVNYSIQMRASRFTDQEVIEALRVLKEAPKPILVHCQHGADRTGVIIAMYRIVFQGWSKEKAIEEMENGGFHYHVQYDNIPAYIRGADVVAIRGALGG
jgi:protein tyrosine/serine phosphatase